MREHHPIHTHRWERSVSNLSIPHDQISHKPGKRCQLNFWEETETDRQADSQPGDIPEYGSIRLSLKAPPWPRRVGPACTPI